jgi:hypothetical protein
MSDSQATPVSEPAALTAGTLDLVARAARQGAADASEAAARTWAATGRFTQRFVYTTFYTISYGVAFPSALVASAVPRNNAAVRGLIEGAHAAGQRVDALHQKALESNGTQAPAVAPA